MKKTSEFHLQTAPFLHLAEKEAPAKETPLQPPATVMKSKSKEILLVVWVMKKMVEKILEKNSD